MKTSKNLLFGLALVAAALISSSCSKTYYQVCTTKPVNPALFDANAENYRYEDENVLIEYNMWAQHGDRGFSVYNKTDEYIYISGYNSCFSSYVPDDEGEWTKGDLDNTGIVAPHTWRLITSPKTDVNIYGVANYQPITKTIFLFEGMKEKVRHSESKTFNRDNSPFVFTIHVNYYLTKNGERIDKTIPMAFFVDRVTNYSMKDYLKMKEKYREMYDKLDNGEWKRNVGFRYLPINRKAFYNTYIK